jgi:hypothetical protein
MLLELRSDLEKAADMVNQIEAIRSQLANTTALLDPGTAGVSPATSAQREGQPAPSASAGGSGTSEPGAIATGSQANYNIVKKGSDDLDKKLIEIEDNLIQRRLTGQGQDTTRWPPKLISKINYLVSGLAGGDFPPTNQQREVKAILEEQLATHRRRLDEILSKDLDAFNKLLRDRGIQNVIPRVP